MYIFYRKVKDNIKLLRLKQRRIPARMLLLNTLKYVLNGCFAYFMFFLIV